MKKTKTIKKNSISDLIDDTIVETEESETTYKIKRNPIKCDLKQCICNSNNECTYFVPTIVSKLKPNSIKCFCFAIDFKSSYDDWKRKGGWNASIKKYTLSEDDIIKIKKEKRKSKKKNNP